MKKQLLRMTLSEFGRVVKNQVDSFHDVLEVDRYDFFMSKVYHLEKLMNADLMKPVEDMLSGRKMVVRDSHGKIKIVLTEVGKNSCKMLF